MIWGLRPPLISLFELSYLYNECENIGVADLDRFIVELKKKVGKKNEGALKTYYAKLRRGELTPKEPQGINGELHSKISELKVALRYSQCGYEVVYKGALILLSYLLFKFYYEPIQVGNPDILTLIIQVG